MRSVPPRGSGWVCSRIRSLEQNQILSALLPVHRQPTRYREVVQTSSFRSNSPVQSAFLSLAAEPVAEKMRTAQAVVAAR
jgi:hypothetical protein